MRTRPAWSRPCLVVALLVVLLTVGCLMQLGKSTSAFRSVTASAGAASATAAVDGRAEQGAPAITVEAGTAGHLASDRPEESGAGSGKGQCGKKTVAEAPSFAPAAQPLPVPAVMVPVALAVSAAPPGAAVAGERPGPAPPSPDLAGLCVLRI
ncbi:hypothetical protein [Actinomadura sp. 7K507]|uniref:hypothetical protein n=1 Tax=Actinomadura sp. 7K507 TaxID=2530365 RepID=UPI00105232C3|nr:hypothetical protein [Actinomadura sp. 7K507]TDC85694.1 hypothetical protein E1285_24765 [Actinomadura sp. 7K507]